MTDTHILRWIAKNVQNINGVATPGKKSETIEILWYDSKGESHLITKTGRTELEAFRKCVLAAMRRWKVKK